MWQGLVAEVLLQRTRATQAAPVFEEFQRRYPDPATFADASLSELGELLRPLGLRWRVPLLHALAARIADRDGELPENETELQLLPGVGPYAAAAAISLHGSTRAVLVDSNTVRLICRVVGVPFDAETRRKRWLIELADRLTPRRAFLDYNYAMLDLAMLVCRPRHPRCADCPLVEICESKLLWDTPALTPHVGVGIAS